MPPSPLNPVYLADLFEAGGESLAREVADTFLTEAPKRLAALDAALDAGEWDAAALAAHAVVSGASMIGLVEVATVARQVEFVTRESRRPPDAQLAALRDAVGESRDALATAIGNLVAGSSAA
jgi:HPt (histidine-containing phosphotransfer) domain-containing protein